MRARAASVLLAVAITALTLWVVMTPGTARELRQALAGANWPLLGLAVLIGAGIQWLRAWRFAIMTTGSLSQPDPALVRIAFQLNMWNFLLPFRLGELSYPVLMRRQFGQPLLQAAGVLLLARLFDLLTVAAILLGAAIYLHLAGTGWRLALAVALAAALALGPTLLVTLGRAALPLLRNAPVLGRFAELLGVGLVTLATARARTAAIGLSFAVWLLFAALAMVVVHAIAAAVPLAVTMLGAAAGNLAFALPVNGIAGLGPSQAAWVAAVTRAGVPWREAVVTALALYGVTFLSAVLFGAIATISRPGLTPPRATVPNCPSERARR